MSARGNAAVDYAHLKVQAADDLDVMREVLQLFVVHTEQLMTELAHASDVRTWKQIAHSLKGSARGVGAFTLAEAAADAELAPLDKSKITALNAAFSEARVFISKNPM
ncbi:MAG: Hpt domain-containing protein [Micropepsaceae bacterium]